MAVTGVTVAVELLKKKQKEKKLFSLPPPLNQQRGSILFRFVSLQSLSTACLPPLKKEKISLNPPKRYVCTTVKSHGNCFVLFKLNVVFLVTVSVSNVSRF